MVIVDTPVFKFNVKLCKKLLIVYNNKMSWVFGKHNLFNYSNFGWNIKSFLKVILAKRVSFLNYSVVKGHTSWQLAILITFLCFLDDANYSEITPASIPFKEIG